MTTPFTASRAHVQEDRADAAATATVRIVTDAVLAWLRGEPIDIVEVRARVADAIRDHDRDLQADLIRDLSNNPPAD
jgi:hypothetical protein